MVSDVSLRVRQRQTNDSITLNRSLKRGLVHREGWNWWNKVRSRPLYSAGPWWQPQEPPPSGRQRDQDDG